MSLSNRFLFAMLSTIVALAATGGLGGGNAESVLRPNAHLPYVAAASAWYEGGQANESSRRPGPFTAQGELLPSRFRSVQFNNPQDLGVGKVLVASRSLGDPDFAETVVLLVRYDDEGVVGLILNRRTDVPLSRILDLEAAKGRSDPVYFGGPVAPSGVFALVQSSSKMEKAENIFGGVYLISDKTLFEQTIAARPDPGAFHVYLGYAGWTQDQLRAETQLGAWFIFPADTATVFNADPESLWLQMIHKTELHFARAEPFGLFEPRSSTAVEAMHP